MRQELRERPIVLAALSCFAVYLALGIMHHEAWRDEWQAINLARAATSLPDLYQRLRYEGHPALWYLCIKGAWQIFPSLVSVQLLNAAFALAAAALVAFLAPWPLWLRLLVAFSGPAAWEYSIKARSYGLGWLLIVALALVLRRPAHRWKPWLVALLAALALNTSIFTGIVSFSLVLGWLWEERRGTGLRALLWPMAALAATTLGTFLLGLPAEDVAVGSLTAPKTLDLSDLAQVITFFADTMLPTLNLDRAHPALVLFCAALVAYLCSRHLQASSGARIAQLAGWLCILLFFLSKVVHHPYPWHRWHLLLVTIAAAIAFEHRDRIPLRSLTVLAVLAVLALNSGIRDYRQDWHSAYSGALPAARAIKQAGLDHLPVVVTVSPFLASLSGYLGKPVYDATASEARFYKIWKKNPRPKGDAVYRAHELSGTNPERSSLFSHCEPLLDETLAALAARYRVQLTHVGSFVAEATGEDHHVYLMNRIQP